ncbi:MAG: HlyD family efflux transporter periplasmic adaptor subunit [Flavobacteriaceae bacterium]|nr:HlyD family efflux transporter periplasmic adaptor subunit [Flavobacteriaceae bacterium]
MFFIFSIILASIFSFNEVIVGSVIITSKNPPVQILSKKTGKISSINYGSGDSISEGAVLAIIENPANEKDIAYLREKLPATISMQTSIDALNIEFPRQLNLGNSIQPFYNVFLSRYQKLILESSLREGIILQMQLKDQLSNQNLSLKNKKEELLLAKQSLNILEVNFHRHQKLLSKGVISQLDLERVENEFLNEKRQFHFQEQQLNQIILDKNSIEKNQQLVKNSDFKNGSIQEAELILARQDLLNEISEWEENFLLKSPIEGRLSYNDIWGKFQDVKSGEAVFTVVPYERQNLIGKCELPIRNSGKIRKDQKVFLKLENFPYREWGTVEASVGSISQVPRTGENPGYVVYLNIDDLNTSYGKKLEFNQELIGTAEILLEEVTVLERLFYQFRNLWSN